MRKQIEGSPLQGARHANKLLLDSKVIATMKNKNKTKPQTDFLFQNY